MTDLFLDIWTFAFSQLGLVAIGVLAAPRLRKLIAGERCGRDCPEAPRT